MNSFNVRHLSCTRSSCIDGVACNLFCRHYVVLSYGCDLVELHLNRIINYFPQGWLVAQSLRAHSTASMSFQEAKIAPFVDVIWALPF